MRALVFVAILVAGCSQPVPAPPPAPEPVLYAPAQWYDGMWWTYDVTDADGTQQVTLAVSKDDGTWLDVSERDVALSAAAGSMPIAGKFNAELHWTGSRFVRDTFDVRREDIDYRWFEWPLRNGSSWAMEKQWPQSLATVVAMDERNATIEYDGRFFQARGTYDVTVGWFTSLTLGDGTTWRLIDHGVGSTDARWRAEAVNGQEIWLGLLSYLSVDVRGATDLLVEFRLFCNSPGFNDFRLGPESPVTTGPIMYQDTCPGVASRDTWLDVTEWDYARVETEGIDASTALTTGIVTLTAFYVEQIGG